MIDVITNGFLTNPVPIQFTGNYCSHRCTYCFANINNPKRRLDLKAVLSQVKNFHKRNDLPSYFMREKYPLLISNNIDPFSKSNQPFVNELIDILTGLDIPIALATRGGVGWREVSQKISPSVWYVTIPYSDDAIRKHYEPNAPSIAERWDLLEKIIKAGHKAIVSINPLNQSFVTKPLEIIKRAQGLGVKSFVINRLHLSPKQQANLTEREKVVLGESLLHESKQKDFTDEWIDSILELMEYCFENELNLMGADTGLYTDNFKEFSECYEKVLPTVYGFFNWCFDNKIEGDLLTFDDFYKYFADRLPDIEGNVSKYIFNRAVISDKDFYKTMNLRNLLHLYWQHPKVGLGLAKNYPAFSWAKKQYPTKLDFLYDTEHNQILHYNGVNFNPEENVTIK